MTQYMILFWISCNPKKMTIETMIRAVNKASLVAKAKAITHLLTVSKTSSMATKALLETKAISLIYRLTLTKIVCKILMIGTTRALKTIKRSRKCKKTKSLK